MPQIVFSDIGKQYGHGRFAVENLNLNLPDGSFTAILGPSGCGKTTTLRMLAGLEQPTTGTIRVGERVYSCAERAIFVPVHERELGLVFQNYALWPHLNVMDNVQFGLTMHKVPRPKRRERAIEMLELLRVDHLADRLPSQLSGGEQQRVAIARALAPSPSLVMFDEPFSNLDAPLRLELSTELKRLHKEINMTALLVTHDQAEAMAVATELVVMRAGHLEQVGPPLDVYRSPASVHVASFIGNPPMNLSETNGSFAQLCEEVGRRRGVTANEVHRIGIRPEHVLIDSPHPGWQVSAVVDSVLLMGPSAIVRLSLEDGSELVSLIAGESDLAPGRQTDLTVEFDRVHLFDEGGWRLDDGAPPLAALHARSAVTEAVLP